MRSILRNTKNNSLMKGGIILNLKLKEKINESLSAVLPITGIVLMISVFLIPMELGSVVMFLTGALLVWAFSS